METYSSYDDDTQSYHRFQKMVQVNPTENGTSQYVFESAGSSISQCHILDAHFPWLRNQIEYPIAKYVFKWNIHSTKCSEIWKIILLPFSFLFLSHTIYIMYLLRATFGCYCLTSKQKIMEKTKIYEIVEWKIKRMKQKGKFPVILRKYTFLWHCERWSTPKKKNSSKGSKFKEQIYPFSNEICLVFSLSTCLRPLFAHGNGWKSEQSF